MGTAYPGYPGDWIVKRYGSGQTNVMLAIPFEVEDPPRVPWLQVYGPISDQGARQQRDRDKVARDLAGYLNGGPRPAWLDDLVKRTEVEWFDLDGTTVAICGPMIDRNPPRMDWVTDQRPEAKAARAALVEHLFPEVLR